MTLTRNKPLQLFVLMLSIFMLTALVPHQADARKNKNKRTNTSVNRNKSSNKNVNVNRNKNTNVNVNRNKTTNVNVNSNKNRNVNVDVNVDRRGRRHHNGNFWTGVAVGVTTAVIVGTVVQTLPPTGCTTVIQNGITYSQCGTVRYQPQYSGNNVTYIVVN